MDYDKEKDFVSFLFKEMHLRGIKHYKHGEREVVGPSSKIDINDIMSLKDETYVTEKDLVPKATMQSVDPFKLRKEEKILTD